MYDFLYFYNFKVSDQHEGNLGFIVELKEKDPDLVTVDNLKMSIKQRLNEIEQNKINLFEAVELDELENTVDDTGVTLDVEKLQYILESNLELDLASNTLFSKVDSVDYFEEAREYLD